MIKKIGIVLGTRPEAIKLIPVYLELKRVFTSVELVSTGQHYSMLEQIFKFFEVNDWRRTIHFNTQNIFLCLHIEKSIIAPFSSPRIPGYPILNDFISLLLHIPSYYRYSMITLYVFFCFCPHFQNISPLRVFNEFLCYHKTTCYWTVFQMFFHIYMALKSRPLSDLEATIAIMNYHMFKGLRIADIFL